MAHGKHWEKKGDWLTPRLCILLCLRAAAVAIRAYGSKRPTQSSEYFGTVHCVHHLNLNITSSRMREMSCIKPVHWLLITWTLSSVIPPGHLLCDENGVNKEWTVSVSFLCWSQALFFDRSLVSWSITWVLRSVCRLFRLVMKCLSDVVGQKYLPYPKNTYISE